MITALWIEKPRERENSGHVAAREGRPPAESRPWNARLVRPGGAVETRTASRRYRRMSARVSRELRVVPRKAGLSSPNVGRKGFVFCPKEGGTA